MKTRFTAHSSIRSSTTRSRRPINASYQILVSDPDPYDLACGDVPVHYIDYWEDANINQLKQMHEEELGYNDGSVSEDFDTWLKGLIKEGLVRIKASTRTQKRKISANSSVRNKVIASKIYDAPEYQLMTGQYLPSTGEGDSFATQVATALNKLIYKWYNDGDVYDNNYGLDGFGNDLSSYANWLYKYIPSAQGALEGIYRCRTEDDYERLLARIASEVWDNEDLTYWSRKPKQGTIYRCDGPFSFNADLYDEEYY